VTTRHHRCDVPGCERPRKRWQRLCERCFSTLPRDIRAGILEAYQQRRFRDHRAACRRARDHFAEIEQRNAEPRPQQWWQRD